MTIAQEDLGQVGKKRRGRREMPREAGKLRLKDRGCKEPEKTNCRSGASEKFQRAVKCEAQEEEL